MERELTFRDQIEAARQRKKREVIERLARILSKEFDLDDLRFVQNGFGDAVLIESFEIARNRGSCLARSSSPPRHARFSMRPVRARAG